MTNGTPSPFQAPAQPLGASWSALPAWAPIPGLGMLVNNAFVHAGPEPMLVDTGFGMFGDGFIEALGSVVEPADLRWIWLSHADPDHTGNLERVLALAPKAQVLVGMLGLAKLQLAGRDVSRCRVVMPGESVEIGGRRLRAVRPPCYDAPETLGFHDPASGTLYAVDTFGAVLPGTAASLDDIGESTLRDGLVAWGAVDAPWQADLEPTQRAKRFHAIEQLAPARVLTAHLPLGLYGGQRLARAAMVAAQRLPADMMSLDAAVLDHAAPNLAEALPA